ncbi:MAG: membrane protein insertase YidC [Clostridiales bacterium]|nr:membrane protein insertase YidC [Clostridiales bacterium]
MGIVLTQSNTFIIGSIAKLLGFIMNGIFNALSYIGIENIGLSIIIFTVIVYTLMIPMTIKQQKFSRMSAVMNPEIQKIQKKYKNKKDQASMMKMQEETKLVYEKYGTSPTGGCLGSLIQFPILFALWPVIQNIPAYVTSIKDAYMPLVNQIMATDGYQKIMEGIGKASPIMINPETYDYGKANTLVDVLYKFRPGTWDTLADKFPDLTNLIDSTKNSLTHLNTFLGINIAETPGSMFMTATKNFSIGLIIVALAIPVLSGLSQWISAKLMQQATSTGNDDDNPMAAQMKTMMNVMPLISVFMCFSMPAGLGIYWIASAVVRTIQQLVINKFLSKKSMDELIEENIKKAAKKREKKDAVSGKEINAMAHKNVKNIDDQKRKTTSSNNIDSYKQNAKPGSLASKANMVSDFNKNKK